MAADGEAEASVAVAPARHPIHVVVPVWRRQLAHHHPLPEGVLMTSRPRISCPVCERDVVKRKDGTPSAHYPPPGRNDLACGHGPRAHCRGSHPQEPAQPSVRGGDDIGHTADHDYRHQEQNDRD